MTTTLRLVDGATEVVLRPAIPAAGDAVVCDEWTLTPAKRRTVSRQRAAQRGLVDLTALHDEAQFRASLTIRDGEVTRHQTADVLAGMLDPARRPVLYIQRDGWLAERKAVLSGDPGIDYVTDQAAVSRLKVTVTATIPDGYLTATSMTEDNVAPAGENVGMSYPLSYPKAYTPGAGGATKIVTSAGTIPTPLLLRIYGECVNPAVSTLTLHQLIGLGMTITEGTYVDIDMANRTVLLNGDTSLSYYSQLLFTAGSFAWWELQPGDNLLRFTTVTQSATARVWLYWTDRYAI